MIIYQHRIFRVDLRANPSVTYFFGDNLQRVGLGGQAKEMRGEPNARGVATKRAPSMSPNEFFSDEDYLDNVRQIAVDIAPLSDQIAPLWDWPDEAISFLQRYLRKPDVNYIVPSDGLGTGLSELPTRAPRTHEFLRSLRLAP